MEEEAVILFRELVKQGRGYANGIELGYHKAKGELTMATTLYEAQGTIPTNIKRLVGAGQTADDGVSQAVIALNKGRVTLTYLTHVGADEEQAFGQSLSDYRLLAKDWREVLEEFGQE